MEFTHARLQQEILSASDIVWVPYTAEHLVEGFEDGIPIGLEYYLSTRWISFLFDGGWVLYLGERAFRYIIREIRLPFLPLPNGFGLWLYLFHIFLQWGLGDFTYQMAPSLRMTYRLGGAFALLKLRFGATQILGDVVLGSLLMTNWIACFREPSHLSMIANLTYQLKNILMYCHYLGGDPSLAGTFDSYGHKAGLSSTGGFVDGQGPFDYRPNTHDMPTQEDLAQVDHFDDSSTFLDSLCIDF